MLMGGGVQTKGGIVLELEGKVLVAGTEDLGSVPDEAGRRWIAPSVLGKILGMNQFKGSGGGIYYRKSLYKEIILDPTAKTMPSSAPRGATRITCRREP